jgi:hypothetical protein
LFSSGGRLVSFQLCVSADSVVLLLVADFQPSHSLLKNTLYYTLINAYPHIPELLKDALDKERGICSVLYIPFFISSVYPTEADVL